MARMVLSLLAVMALAGLADASSELAAVTAGWPAPGGIGSLPYGVSRATVPAGWSAHGSIGGPPSGKLVATTACGPRT
jgi:hypothetical protein